MTWQVWALIAIEIIVVFVAGCRRAPDAIRGAGVVSNMVLIALFAPLLIDVFGSTANIGCVFYATAVASQIVVLERWGPFAARSTVPMAYARLLPLWLSCWVISVMPAVPGNEEFVEAARIVATRQASVVLASFAAFALSQMVLIITYERVRPRAGPVAAMVLSTVACQAVDTPVFFIVAFGQEQPADALHLMATGFLLKLAIGLTMVPIIFYCARRGNRHPK